MEIAVPLSAPHAQPEVAPSLSQLCLEVLLALFLYDLLFTLGHIACHRSDGLLIGGGFTAGSNDKQNSSTLCNFCVGSFVLHLTLLLASSTSPEEHAL